MPLRKSLRVAVVPSSAPRQATTFSENKGHERRPQARYWRAHFPECPGELTDQPSAARWAASVLTLGCAVVAVFPGLAGARRGTPGDQSSPATAAAAAGALVEPARSTRARGRRRPCRACSTPAGTPWLRWPTVTDASRRSRPSTPAEPDGLFWFAGSRRTRRWPARSRRSAKPPTQGLDPADYDALPLASEVEGDAAAAAPSPTDRALFDMALTVRDALQFERSTRAASTRAWSASTTT